MKSIGAGAVLGGVALVSRYAPGPPLVRPAALAGREAAPARPSPRAAPPAIVADPAASSVGSSAATPALPDRGAPAEEAPMPLVMRFGGGLGATPGAPGWGTAAASGSPAALLGAAAPRPRAARFDEDPVARAACPEDMALVEGDFCPALRYDCLHPGRGAGCGEYLRGNRCTEPVDHRRYCIDRHEWPNRVGENPLVYVDWFEAKAQCAAAGKRLCRRSEWILACEGPKRLPFPWGFVRQPSPCNIDRAAIPFDVGAMLDPRTREEELARLWQADRIGAHPDCVSAFGAYDLSGNVDEWTDDQADNPASKHPSTLNGGYWGPVRNTCRLSTKTHGPTFKFYQVGFRCCGDTIDGIAVPKPAPFIELEDRE